MMRRYGRWIWLGLGIFFIVGFAFFESSAINNDGLTLSRLIYDANQAWPITSVIFGAVFGGLAVHFFWQWDPKLYAAQERIKILEGEKWDLTIRNAALSQRLEATVPPISANAPRL